MFSYWQQERSTKWLFLYASTLDGDQIKYKIDSINSVDDPNILTLAKKDKTVKTYLNAHTVNELHQAWCETYETAFDGNIIFNDDSQAYILGKKPLRKKDLMDFSFEDKIVNKFEEILRHNNISDKENAFNRLIALFICKLVDEINKDDNDIVEFQYKPGTDTYESLQDRLQKLHQQGMKEFMKEDIFYVSDDYAKNIVVQYTGQNRENLIKELQKTLRSLKFFTNNDFAFKDVHNEELFYQNSKVLVEIVKLFEKFRIIKSNNLQFLGDLFEQLLNKGFKQNEGQFFTPIPITRFMWESLPLNKVVRKEQKISIPKIIDYACGAGHFLTEGYETLTDFISKKTNYKVNHLDIAHKLYGVEKDYRLARVSKISLFMHGAGEGNIIFGDGLENYPDKNITNESFDILMANPPYSVSSFKPHLDLKNNQFTLLNKISNDGSEIETLFVERIAQLVKPGGVAAVVLPTTMLNKEAYSFVGAREILLQNFYIRTIALFGSKTFGATGTNTIILFLERFSEPPKRSEIIKDSIQAIFSAENIADWEDNSIFRSYLRQIGVDFNDYGEFLMKSMDFQYWEQYSYFEAYVEAFSVNKNLLNKQKTNVFNKLSEVEKQVWMNNQFYEYVMEIEKEKLFYFALVYDQQTVVITPPSENKEQELFLGYKWSNRKGSEGIQLLRNGGKLYNSLNRFEEDNLASIVRGSYLENVPNIEDLNRYYECIPLKDLMDYKSVDFNKSIKTVANRDRIIVSGSTLYNLSDKIFEISIGRRIVANELIDNGIVPVYSANVYEPVGMINKELLNSYENDSIVWGIDGDWMVNVIPANQKFYPTDHCGVIRIKSDKILPHYFKYALEVEGKVERFSRSNRASSQRMKKLSVLIPEMSVQKEFVGEVSTYDNLINEKINLISEIQMELKNKFIELFSDPEINEENFTYEKLNKVSDYFIGLTYSPEDISSQGKTVLRSGNIQNSLLDLSDIVKVDKSINDKLLVRNKDILMCTRNGSANLVGKVALIDAIENNDLTFGAFMTIFRSKYYGYLMTYFQLPMFKQQFMSTTMSINQITIKMLDKVQVPMPNDKTLLLEYNVYYDEKFKELLNLQEAIIEIKNEKKIYINKHFNLN